MKKLIFVRHGKAEDLVAEFSDFERSLTPKGKNISKLMARKLMEKEKSPGIIITSPAFRAIETALIFAGEFGYKNENIIINTNIYSRLSFHNFHEILSHVKEETDTLTLFGHNPSFSEIADILCSEGCDFLPKCGIAGISFKISTWSEVRRNTGKLEYFLKPEKVL